jgi:hypothetical protein
MTIVLWLFMATASPFSNVCFFSSSAIGYAVAQLVETLCYKLEGHGFDSWWCHWNFTLT